VSPAENAGSLEHLLDELAESSAERETMGRALRLLPYALPDVEPPSGLRGRVLAAATSQAPTFQDGYSYFARSAQIPWNQLAAGVEMKDLHREATGSRTSLIRMQPNVPFPPHPHGFIEDLYVLEGDAWVGDIHMDAGDYCRAPAGTEHNDVRSGELGVVALVVSR
jgi:hypothetical protein